jgi:uncharacterized OsmC-like protein
MTLVSPDLKQAMQKLYEDLKSSDDPFKSTRPSTAVTKMIGPQASEASWDNDLVIRSDERAALGGGGSAPSPLSIFAASIGFAENAIFARNAAMQDVDFDSLETKIEASWDRKGLFQIDGKDPSIFMIHIETKVGTAAPSEKVAELLKLTHKTSPLTATVAKVVTIHRKLFVNGNEVKM